MKIRYYIFLGASLILSAVGLCVINRAKGSQEKEIQPEVDSPIVDNGKWSG